MHAWAEFTFSTCSPKCGWALSSKTHRSGCVENFQHALLSVHLDLFSVAILNGWIVFLHKDPLYELYCECWFANTTATKHDNLVFTHPWFVLYEMSCCVYQCTVNANRKLLRDCVRSLPQTVLTVCNFNFDFDFRFLSVARWYSSGEICARLMLLLLFCSTCLWYFRWFRIWFCLWLSN